MGRPPCCDESRSLKKGPWTPEEDQKLVDCIRRHGHGNWSALPKLAGLNRCGKSCRLRWTNYLRPDIRRGRFSEEEERIIINLHSVLGNKWSRIASHLPGRTDNEIKNFWNTHIRKKFLQMGIDPITHKPRVELSQLLNLPQTLYSSSPFGNLSTSPFGNNNALKLQTDATQLARIELLQNLLQLMNTSAVIPNVGNYSGALGFDNLNQPFQNVMAQSTLQNHGSSPQTTGELEAQINSLSWFEPGLEQFEGLNDHDVISNESSSYGHNIQQECKLPPMVNASCDETPSLSQTDHHFAAYEAWEKFIDDETTDSCWKKFLDSRRPRHHQSDD